MKNLIVYLVITLCFSACQKTAPNTEPPNNAPKSIAAASPTISATAAPTIADGTKTKTFNGTGVVTKINLEILSVELKHDEIKGLMPAMQMEFYVSDKKMLEDLKVGDTVDFVLEDDAGAEKITAIKKK